VTSKSLRVGLIGYGVSGAVFHAPLITSIRGLDLAVIATSNRDRMAAARKACPEAEVIGDIDDFWQLTGSLDLIVIATPNRSHVTLAERAIEAGVPVLVDKPLSVSCATAERLLNLSKARAVPLCVFQNRRWDSDFLTVNQVLANGLVGTPMRVDSRFELYRPLNPLAWRESPDRESGGGVLFDLGSHLIDQAIVLFGHPRTVYSEINCRRTGAVIDDDTFVSLTFEGDVTCHLWMSKCARAAGPRFRIVGSDAVFEIADTDPQWEALQSGERPGGPHWGEHPSQGVLTSGDWTNLQKEFVQPVAGAYEEFYRLLRDALASHGPMPVDPIDALEVLRVVEAARESHAAARVVSLIPTPDEAQMPSAQK